MIDEVLTTFYQKSTLRLEFGHIYIAPAYYAHENLELWRPAGYQNDVAKSYATTFEIKASGADAFARQYPLSHPHLPSNEEFVVIRAKPRPLVLLIPEQPIDEVQHKKMSKIWRPRCLTGQVFGLSDPITGVPGFAQQFINRVRMLEFPQLLFLPAYSALFPVDRLLRLDECQSVFTPHLRDTGFALHDDVKKLLRSQISFLLTGEYAGDYATYRELLLAEYS